MLLAEGDTLYVGDPFSPVIDPFDGSIYVPDMFSNRVLRFARDGSPLRVYGRPGGGPGEFRATGVVFVLDDSTVAAQDQMSRRLNLYDRRTGAVGGTRGFQGLMGTGPPVVRGDSVWAAVFDLDLRASVAVWDTRSDTVRYLGAIPAEYVESVQQGFWRFAASKHHGALAVSERWILRGWAGLDRLFELDRDGAVLDSVEIPAVRRRGVPPNIRELLDVQRIGLRQRIELAAYLRQLHRLPDGSFAFTHHEQRVLKLEPMPVLAADVYVGVLSPDLERACVDTKLHVSPDARPMETFRGDTLFLLDRRITEGERLETWIVLYRIDTSRCDWLATRPGS